jgi:hypothetical protein
MTEVEIQCLKDNLDKTVEIDTVDGERLIARVLAVFHDEEYDEHELFYELVSSNMPASYARGESAGGFALGFDKILAVRPSSWGRSS